VSLPNADASAEPTPFRRSLRATIRATADPVPVSASLCPRAVSAVFFPSAAASAEPGRVKASLPATIRAIADPGAVSAVF
jgi:hypothetical protein